MQPLVANARAILAARAAEARAQSDAKATRVRELLPGLAQRLRDECRAREIWLFGSLATGGFDDRSDCDLGIACPTAGDFGRALGLVATALPVDCDLVRLDTCSPQLAARIRSGVRL